MKNLLLACMRTTEKGRGLGFLFPTYIVASSGGHKVWHGLDHQQYLDDNSNNNNYNNNDALLILSDSEETCENVKL